MIKYINGILLGLVFAGMLLLLDRTMSAMQIVENFTGIHLKDG
jgi:hypothetical protein